MAPVVRRYLSRADSNFHNGLTPQDREDLLKLQTLQELPKARYATKLAITALPSRRGRKAVFSHVEVYKMVEQVATTLREAGVRPNTVCAMSLENSLEAIVYFLALQWIGAIAAPVDTQLTYEDTLSFLKSVRAATVVSATVESDEQEENELFQKMKKACEELDLIEWHITRTINDGVILEMHGRRASEGAAWKGGSGDFKPDSSQIAVHHASVAGDLSLVIALTHGNFATAIRMFASTYNLTSDETTILTRPWYSVDGILSTLATIYSGGHIIVPGQLVTSADDQFLQTCAELRVGWFTEQPDFIAALCEQGMRDKAVMKGVKFSFIRLVGGNVTEAVLDEMEAILQAPVLEAYGTPESCGIVSSNVETEYKAGTKGKAVADCSVRIFHPDTYEDLGPNKEGMVGVSGKHVSSGYLGNEDANNKVLITGIAEDGSEILFFLTGDKGSLDDDGFLTVKVDPTEGRAAKFADEVRERKRREEQLEENRERERLEEEQELRNAGDAENVGEAVAVEEAQVADRAEKKTGELFPSSSEEDVSESTNEDPAAEPDAISSRESMSGGEEDHIQCAKDSDGVAAEAKTNDEMQRESGSEGEVDPNMPANDSEEPMRTDDSASLVEEREQEQIRSGVELGEPPNDSGAEAVNDAKEEHNDDELPAEVRSISEEGVQSHAVPQPQIIVREVDPEILHQIMERLGAIEANQKRLECEIEVSHRREMDEMKMLVHRTEDAYRNPPPPPVVQLNMEEVNSAMQAVATAAQDSSRNTEQAVKAANAAAEAAERATMKLNAAQELSIVRGPSNVVEVRDTNKVRKTMRVSLDEVETAMKSHPAVAAARAFGRPDKKYGTEVFCAVKPKVGARLSEPWLKLHAQGVLPQGSVPKRFFLKENLEPDYDRTKLANDTTLKRVSAHSGYSNTKKINGPTWSPAPDK